MRLSIVSNATSVSQLSSTSTVVQTPQGATLLASDQLPFVEADPFSRFPHTEEMVRLGTQAVFRLRSSTVTQPLLRGIERRERAVLLLLDGQRTLRDITRLLHRNEVEVAQVVIRLLKQGYAEYLGIKH